MPALTTDQKATWRTAPYSITTDVFIHAPVTVFAARVNQASFTYPLTSLTFDTVTTGAYTDIQEGQMLLIGSSAGADDLGRVRVRKTLTGTIASSTVLYIQRSSNGIRDGELNPSDNSYLTVLDLRRPWSIPPYIDDDGVTYIDTDKTFALNRSYPPVANGDPDVLKVVRDGSASVSLTFGNVAGYATNPDATSTLTHAWTFHSTCTPNTSTSASPTITVPVNTVFYAAHTVTDSVGTAYTHYSLVAVVEPTHANLRPCKITSHTARADGQQIQLEFVDSIPYSTYPDGTEVLIAKNEKFGTTATDLAGVTDRKHMLFSGWIYEEDNEGSATQYGFKGRSTITCYDSANWLNALPGYPTIVERESSPTRWEHMKTATILRYVHRLLWAYSNILTRSTFTDSIASGYPFPTLGSDGMSLYEQADQRAQAVTNKLTCDKNNRLAMKDDPMLAQSIVRTSTVIVPIEERDWRSYRYRYTRPPRTHWNWGEAIGTSTIDAEDIGEVTTYFCVAPGEAPGQGLGNQSSGQQLVTSQSELNEREGHRYAARMNNRLGYIEVTMRGGEAGIDPALMEWVQFEITSNTAGPRGRTVSASTERFLPIEVSYDYNHDGSTREVRLTIEKEVQGQPAATYYPPTEEYNPTPYPINPYPDPIIQFPDDTYPEDYWLRSGANRIALICKNGLARTTNFGSGDATVWDFQAWSSFSPAGNISVLGNGALTAVPDGFTYGTSAVKCWVVYSTESSPAKIYYLDVTNRTWTLKHTFSAGWNLSLSRMGQRHAGADASFGTQNHFVATVYSSAGSFGSGQGTRMAYTTDNSTFTESTLSTVYNSAVFTASAEPKPPSVYVSSKVAGKVAVGVMSAADHNVLRVDSTDYGASWSSGSYLSGTSSENTSLANSLHYPWDTARNADESICFYGAGVKSSTANTGLYRFMNGSYSVIKSGAGGNVFATRNGISTATTNANRLLACIGSSASDPLYSLPYLTDNALAASPSFTVLNTNGQYYDHCAIAGDSGSTFYFWGGQYGSSDVACSTNSGTTITSQAGNLWTSYSPGEAQMLVGW